MSMSTTYSFSCQFLTTSLCFSGSSCAPPNNNNQQDESSCICPINYGHGYYFFHDPDCSMHNSIPYVFLAMCTLVMFVSLIQFRADHKASRSTVRQVVDLAMLFVISLWLHSIFYVAQGGNYEGFCVLQGLTCIVGAYWIEDLMTITAIPLFQTNTHLRERMKSLIRICRITLVLTGIVTGTILTALCRFPNSTFNIAVVVLATWQVAVVEGGFIGTYSLANALLQVMEKNIISRRDMISGDSTMDVARDKLKALTKQLRTLGISVLVTYLPWIITHLCLGSSPFSWVFFMLGHVLNMINIAKVSHTLAKTTPHSSQEQEMVQSRLVVVQVGGESSTAATNENNTVSSR
jgi:hypothetical protein